MRPGGGDQALLDPLLRRVECANDAQARQHHRRNKSDRQSITARGQKF